MLDGVGQRLEPDAQEVMLLPRVEVLRRAVDAHVGAGDRAVCHLPRHFCQGAGEVAALERLRAKIGDRSPSLFLAVAQHLAGDIERSPRRLRRVIQVSRHGLQLQRDAGQALLERVVGPAAARGCAR